MKHLSALQLKKGMTEQFKKDDNVIQLYFQGARFYIQHKRPNGLTGLVSYATHRDALKYYKAKVNHLLNTTKG